MLEPIVQERQTLATQVYESIRAAIVERRLGPGARVTESEVAAQLGVSKTPVREALVRLAHVGLVEPTGARGLRVATPSRRQIIESYQVRIAIETQAVRLAAERRTDADLIHLQGLASRSVASAHEEGRAEYRRVNPSLHRAIGACSGNDRLANLVCEITDLLTTLRARDTPLLDTSALRGQQHVDIVEAIGQRDGDRAALLMREHLEAVLQALLRNYDQAETELGHRAEHS